ncbi:MAG: hypothetical protein K0R27_3062 [Xanthobacteraceae bacterium]|jgi:hypothetical protein|nr:hypothetical protein [Xanthobacteraceae bacterium]
MKRLAMGLAALVLAGTAALAEPSSTELFFDKPYLASVAPGSKITYAYKHVTTRTELGESFDEKLEMSVDAAPQGASGRVADVDIWRGDKHGEAGPFPTESGNPISLVLLERDVREMAALSKGSPFYIRNRVRDALGNGTVEETRFDYQGKQVAGWKMTMTPFAADPNKDKLAELVGRRYVFLFSDEVPGGLYEVRVVTPKLDGSANIIETSLTLSGSTPPAGK